MQVALVTGTVVATRKPGELTGLTLLVLQPADSHGRAVGDDPLVAVDAVGAGQGDVVLYVAGSSARQTQVTQDRPVDATVMAIVDTIEVLGAGHYNAASAP